MSFENPDFTVAFDIFDFRSKSSGETEGSRHRKLSLKQREDFEETFNRVMDQERERREKARSVADFNKWDGVKAGPA